MHSEGVHTPAPAGTQSNDVSHSSNMCHWFSNSSKLLLLACLTGIILAIILHLPFMEAEAAGAVKGTGAFRKRIMEELTESRLFDAIDGVNSATKPLQEETKTGPKYRKNKLLKDVGIVDNPVGVKPAEYRVITKNSPEFKARTFENPLSGELHQEVVTKQQNALEKLYWKTHRCRSIATPLQKFNHQYLGCDATSEHLKTYCFFSGSSRPGPKISRWRL